MLNLRLTLGRRGDAVVASERGYYRAGVGPLLAAGRRGGSALPRAYRIGRLARCDVW